MTTTTSEIYDPFSDEKALTVTAVEVLRTPVLRAAFSDGEAREIDFSDLVERSRWFRPLAVPTTFETVEIIHDGRALQWVTGVDYCVDALRIKGDEQRGDAKEAT